MKRKRYRKALRELAKQGIGHDASGAQRKLEPSSNSAAKCLLAGYKLIK